MGTEEKRDTLLKALTEAQAREYVAWLNWQVAQAQVERLGKVLASEKAYEDQSKS